MLNVSFIGRLGRDSEAKTSKNGNEYLSFTVASDDKRGGENVTTWVNCTWYGAQAVKMAQWLKKGSLVSVSGSLQTRIYQTKNNDNAISHDVNVWNVSFVNAGSGNTQSDSSETANSSSESANDGATTGTFKKPVASAPAADDDDLPF